MFCCSNCFNSKYLDEIIEASGSLGNCDFCGSQNIPVHPPELLIDLFQNILNYFSPDPASKLSLFDFLDKLPQQIFSLKVKNNRVELLKQILSEEWENYRLLFEQSVNFQLDESNYYQKSWDNFKNEIKGINRFHIGNALNLIELGKQFKKFEFNRRIPKGNVFYRGRVSDKNGFGLRDMGNPPSDKARGGRANPAGISYLYVADQPETTLYETRASLLDYVTIAEFELKRDLNVMNLRDDSNLDIISWAESEELEMFLFIYKLQEELSKPYRSNDLELDYIPTQYICEFIKSLEYDGVEYKSSLYPDGYNVAFFYPEKLKGVTTSVHEIKSIGYSHQLV